MNEGFVNLSKIPPEMYVALFFGVVFLLVGWHRPYSTNASTLLAIGPAWFGSALVIGTICVFVGIPILGAVAVAIIFGLIATAGLMLLKGRG